MKKEKMKPVLKKLLHSGRESVVYKGIYQKEIEDKPKPCVVKIVRKMRDEKKILEELQDIEGVVKLWECFTYPALGWMEHYTEFRYNKFRRHLVFEHLKGGDFFKRLLNFSHQEIWKIFL